MPVNVSAVLAQSLKREVYRNLLVESRFSTAGCKSHE
jgi:hypothetical protein